ncbi:uncharacterized protein LOC142644077 [Castanea sativa]|uniref:uncharacterized protein LOC142644077 n=1 Tax=Castanea sativa TaxID=21020 RepID=UPI003F64F3FD
MNPMKYAFGVSAGKFLGFLLHHKGISVDPAKAMAIATMKRPTTAKELKSFLGRVSYIKKFVPGLASVTTSNSKAMGALLAQEDDDGNEQPIYYVSRILKDAETRKDSAMVGFTLSIRHRYQDFQGCQKPSHSRPANPVPPK